MPEGYFDAGVLATGDRICRDSVPDGNNTITHIWVPNTITEIGTWVFRNYTVLKEVVFEDGPTPLAIGMMAFEGCTSLVRVSLPGRVYDVGTACFRGCANLADFEIANGEAVFTMPARVFDGCVNKDKLCAILETECCRRRDDSIRRIEELQANGRRGNAPVETSTDVGNYVLFPRMIEEVIETVRIPEEVPNGTLFVLVDQTWGMEKRDETTGQRIALEDCARGYWCNTHLRKVRLAECRWLMAISKGKIEGVWKIDLQTGWKPPEEISKPTWPSDKGPWEVPRSGCLFMTDDDETLAMRALCVGKHVAMSFAQYQTVRGVFKRQGHGRVQSLTAGHLEM